MDFTAYILRKFSLVRALERQALRAQREGEAKEFENQELRAEIASWTKFCPHGHFYSPLPSKADIAAAFSRQEETPPFPAIDFNEARQFELLREFASFKDDFPFGETVGEGRRFHLDNPSFSRYDAFVLYGVMRRLRPKRLIEVGCGHTSSAILDLNDLLLGGRLELTFIDPDLAEFRRRIPAGEAVRATLIEKPVQDVPTDVFAALEADDILFLDTSHISKIGSDVNHLFFRVLPALKPGVWVHIHDITADLEYPRHFFDMGRAWNEIYVLRAFLMYNRDFEVMFSSAFLYDSQVDFFKSQLPAFAAGGGCQMWLRKRDSLAAPEAGMNAARTDSGAGGREGNTATADGTSRLINCSARGHVGPGANVLSCGFVVGGGAPKTILVRAVGPGLAPAGVADVLAEPLLQVFASNPGNGAGGPQVIASVRAWGLFPKPGLAAMTADIRAASAAAMAGAGAFPLAPGSADAAMILTLKPGSYSAEVSGLNKGTGNALVEIYEMP